jgi:tetratricopeptide (TPR) repeat protein
MRISVSICVRFTIVCATTWIMVGQVRLYAQQEASKPSVATYARCNTREREPSTAGHATALSLSPDARVTRSLEAAETALSASPRRYADAEDAYRFVVYADPEDPRGYFGLGRIFSDQGQYSKAVEAYKKAVAAAPAVAEARFNLGLVYVRLGNKDDAMKQVRVLQRLRPSLAGILEKNVNSRL